MSTTADDPNGDDPDDSDGSGRGIAATAGRRRDSVGDEDERVLRIDEDESDRVFEVLSDPTARAALKRIQSGPATAERVARSLDEPPDVVEEYLEDLVNAGLVERRGGGTNRTSAPTYAATSRAVIEFGDRRDRYRDRPLVRLVGGVLALAVSAGVVQWLLAPGSSAGLLFFLGGVTVLLSWVSIVEDW